MQEIRKVWPNKELTGIGLLWDIPDRHKILI